MTMNVQDAAVEILKMERHRAVVLDLIRISRQHHTLPIILHQSIGQIARGIEIGHAKILRYRPEKGDLLVEAGVGWKRGFVGNVTFSTDLTSPAGKAFQTGQPVLIHDLNEDTGFVYSRALREHAIVSLANVPISLDNGTVWGVLEVDGTQPRSFGESTTMFLVIAATVIGIAISREAAEREQLKTNARLVAEAQKHRLLLRETNHRIKNNFQLILAAISFCRNEIETDNGRQILDELTRKILAMSLAHDQLPTSVSGAINLPNYISALAARLKEPFENIAITVHADELNAPIGVALPIGLITNELITNSIKHSFHGKGGSIRVALEAGLGQGEAKLTICDDGGGAALTEDSGSGLQLVESMAQQLRGRVDQLSTDRGTAVCLTFPVDQGDGL